MSIPDKVRRAYAEYESKRSHVMAFREEYHDIIKSYEDYLVQYNDAVNGVRAVIRDTANKLGAKYRDFKIETPKKVSAEVLAELLGHEACVYMSEFSFVLTEEGMDELLPSIPAEDQERYFKITGKVNRKSYDRAVRDQEIPASIANQVEYYDTPRVKGPKAVDLIQ